MVVGRARFFIYMGGEISMPTGHDIAAKALIPLREHWGYIWGTAGKVWTSADQSKSTREMTVKYGKKWIGRKVADCSGLVVWVCKQLGLTVPHGSNSLWKKGWLSEKGETYNRLPVGALVFKVNGNDYHHVGVYVGDGRVVEARGTQAGVVESTLAGWPCYGLLKGFTYDDAAAPAGAAEQREGLPLGSALVDVPNDGTLNVRKSTSTKSAVLTTVREGDTVEVLAVSGDWAKIRYSGTGFVMTKYLKGVVKND